MNPAVDPSLRSSLLGTSTIPIDQDVRVIVRGKASAEIEFKEGSVDATATLAMGLSSAADKVDLLVDSMAQNLRLDVIGRGTDLINTKVIADRPSNLVDVDFDIMKAEIKGPLSGWRSGVMQILGGIGNDELILGVRRGGIESIIDGGPGLDIGFGPGRIVNCEIVN